MPDCRKSHLIFQKFLRSPPPELAPSALGSGLRPLTGPPLSKIPGSAPVHNRTESVRRPGPRVIKYIGNQISTEIQRMIAL